MQREIKFRVLANTDDGEEVIYLGNKEFDNGLWFDAPKHIDEMLHIMQFSGLKDNHGEDIYEGDIVLTPHNGVLKVVFFDGSFQMRKADNTKSDNLCWTYESIIIGNIYENPDLIS